MGPAPRPHPNEKVEELFISPQAVRRMILNSRPIGQTPLAGGRVALIIINSGPIWDRPRLLADKWL